MLPGGRYRSETDFSGQNEEIEEVETSDDESVELSLHQAAREGALDKIREDVRHLGVDITKVINQLNRENQAPLHLAARYNRANVIEYLIQQGASVDLQGENNNTSLHIAVK